MLADDPVAAAGSRHPAVSGGAGLSGGAGQQDTVELVVVVGGVGGETAGHPPRVVGHEGNRDRLQAAADADAGVAVQRVPYAS